MSWAALCASGEANSVLCASATTEHPRSCFVACAPYQVFPYFRNFISKCLGGSSFFLEWVDWKIGLVLLWVHKFLLALFELQARRDEIG